MRFLVYGEDTYRSRRKLAALRERFSATRDAAGLNVSCYRAGEADAAAEALFASPFLAEKKLVVLEGFLRSSKSDQEKIADALARKPESTVAILYEDAGADALAKSPLFGELAKEKFSEEFSMLDAAAAGRFVADECAAVGAKIDAKAARLLVALVGVDCWALHEEASKLASFAAASGERMISEESVRALAADGREASIFALVDAVSAGRPDEAAALLEQLLEGGASELQVIATLAKHYRAAIAAGDLAARGRGDAETLAKALGMHPFPAGKALAFAKKVRPEVLRRDYDRLIQMERAFKSGGPRPKVTLSLFAARLAAA